MKRFAFGVIVGAVGLLSWLSWDLRPREYRHSSRPDLRIAR